MRQATAVVKSLRGGAPLLPGHNFFISLAIQMSILL